MKYKDILRHKELYRFQRARSNWLLHGERNTTLFHTSVFIRRSRNHIRSLKDINRQWTKDSQQLRQLTRDFYISLYTVEPLDMSIIIPDLLPSMLTDAF